jgi:poly(3-hydroxybutyrate) depolymerase
MKKTFVNNRLWLGAITLMGALQGNVFADTAPSLPAMGADVKQISVSGISSGGFMTSHLSTAYSSRIMGAGIIAGGPFYCAGSNSKLKDDPTWETAVSLCMGARNFQPNAQVAFDKATALAKDGKIDDVANLKNQRVYIFNGTKDTVVSKTVVDQTREYYRLAGTADDQIIYIHDTPDGGAGHSIVTNDTDDQACSTEASPYINNCGVEQSHAILNHIYNNTLKAPRANSNELSGKIIKFNQKEFFPEGTSVSNTAYAYIPKVCETESCKVHVAIHGCYQGAKFLGCKFYNGTGYNEIADTNNIIVLYPQAQDSQPDPLNPQGCWDFWGYSSKTHDFYTKDAPQMKAIMAIVDRLGEPRQAK